MYIKTMVIDGFKSYGQRTEIGPFDSQFNAITGLNGTGKSNILDSICFLLGITNLSHVRATNLQELVYKNGQAGITRATVTITFDNRDKNQSPIGYDTYDEITIARQVVIGGKNRYLINGTNVQNNRIQDLFSSVQLNVNNPHFLIMQGRITKVLNMKPPEILSMIEEAAGTRMYETKKQNAVKTIVKKDDKLKEINTILKEEINPHMTKLMAERDAYFQYVHVHRELENLNKLYTAYKYVTLQKMTSKAKGDHDTVNKIIDDLKKQYKDGEEEIVRLEGLLAELHHSKDQESGGALAALEKEFRECELSGFKTEAKLKSMKEEIKGQLQSKQQLTKGITDDMSTLKKKKEEFEDFQKSVGNLLDQDKANTEAVDAAKKRFQAISSGKYSNEGNEEASLQEQLIAATKAIADAQTEEAQSKLRFDHCNQEVVKKRQEVNKASADFRRDQQSIDKLQGEVNRLEKEMTKLNYNEDEALQAEADSRGLTDEVRGLKSQLDSLETKFHRANFQYQDPERNFNHSAVKGVVCNLFEVGDPKYMSALEVAGGSKIYNIVVDSQETSKKLLQNGRLKNRVTFIPLNKIQSNPIDRNTINYARQVVGADNVATALELIDFDPVLRAAMEWVFGGVLICRDMNVAKDLAFNKRINRRAVTWDGDVIDPAGTLSGGSRYEGSTILPHVALVRTAQTTYKEKQAQLQQVQEHLRRVQPIAGRYTAAKHQYNLKQEELKICHDKILQSSHQKQKDEVDALEKKIVELEAIFKRSKETVKEQQKKVKSVEEKLKDSKSVMERELKSAQEELKKAEQKAESARSEGTARKQQLDQAKLEIDEIEKSIENSNEQVTVCEEMHKKLTADAKEIENEVTESKKKVKAMREKLDCQKQKIAAQNNEIAITASSKEKIAENIQEMKLDIKKQQVALEKTQQDSKEASTKVRIMLEKHEWIAEEQSFFGQEGSLFDFSKHNMDEVAKKIQILDEKDKTMSKNVNSRANVMIDSVKQKHDILMSRKKIVEADRKKIEDVIRELDEKKKEMLQDAWVQINRDFGSIFNTLLEGTQARLEPPEGKTFMDGLEVRVAFGDSWKENLSELSGGQRSLVALSLILSLLLFKPAPIYILDEVDAALDLSHTQNIGSMIKAHFKHSQFIIVSLKDGMFNNANVLFRTKFVDGMSTVARVAQNQARRT